MLTLEFSSPVGAFPSKKRHPPVANCNLLPFDLFTFTIRELLEISKYLEEVLDVLVGTIGGSLMF